jgi:hypothetical protein
MAIAGKTEPQNDITSRTLRKEGVVLTPISYSGRTALRREQRDMRPESQNNHLPDNGSLGSTAADNAVNNGTFTA